MDYHPTKLKKDGSLRMGGYGWSARSRTRQEAQFAGKWLSEKEREHKKHVREACSKGGREGRTQDGSQAGRRGAGGRGRVGCE